MKQNLRLLSAIRNRGMRQKEFAALVGVHYSEISRVINGWVNLSEDQKASYAKALDCKKEDLFEV